MVCIRKQDYIVTMVRKVIQQIDFLFSEPEADHTPVKSQYPDYGGKENITVYRSMILEPGMKA